MLLFRITAFIFLTLTSVCASAQAVIQDWQVNVSNCAVTGNTWLASPNIGHGIDFIPAYAAANNYGKDLLVLLTDEHANADIRILDAANGILLRTFATLPTGSSFREHSALCTSEDGYIYVAGFNGTIQRYNVNGTFLGNAVTPSMYPSGAGPRVIAVTGSHTANSLKIFVASGSNIVIFGNGTGSAVNYIGTIQTHKDGELIVLAAAGSHVYCSSYPSPELYYYVVNYTPFSYSNPTTVPGYTEIAKYAADLTPSGLQFAVATAASGRGELSMGFVNWAGDQFTAVPTISAYDQNGNGVFDGGVNGGFYTLGASPHICIEPSGASAYAYFPHMSPSTTGFSAAITKISVSSSGIADWTVY